MERKHLLLKKIETLRSELNERGAELGMSHPKVLDISQKLDFLLNELDRNNSNKKDKRIYKQRKLPKQTLLENLLAVRYII